MAFQRETAALDTVPSFRVGQDYISTLGRKDRGICNLSGSELNTLRVTLNTLSCSAPISPVTQLAKTPLRRIHDCAEGTLCLQKGAMLFACLERVVQYPGTKFFPHTGSGAATFT